MKIAVCVKHVPDGRLRIDEHTKQLDRSGPGDLNSVDRFALEEALRIKDGDGSEVIAIAMGPAAAAETLRTALALGADRAVHACDPAAAGSDSLGTAKVLAKVLGTEQPDLVLFGQQSSDGSGSVLWASVAELLGQPFVSQASTLALDGTTVRVGRQTETGDEVLEASTPLIVSVSDAINEPRYASLKGKMAAKKKPLATLSVADLGLDAGAVGAVGARTTVVSLAPPPVRTGIRKIEDDGTAAERVVEFLTEKGLA